MSAEATSRKISKLEEIAELRAEVKSSETAHLRRYVDDPVGFVREVLHEHLWSGQVNVAESVVANRYTAVPSAHDVGKSFLAARLIAWWLAAHPAGEAFAVSTAPTFAQVRAILWREVGQAHRAGRLPGHVNQTEWHLEDVGIIGYGRKPADWDPAAFQGIHARYVLAVIDESGGVPRQLWDAVDSIVTNEGSRVLAIGNPDDASSHFERVCRPGSGWNVIHLDGLDSPNFTDEPIPEELRPLLLSPTWVAERKARWGEASPLYVSKVRGQFPELSEDLLIPAAWVSRAQERWRDLSERIAAGEKEALELDAAGAVLGVDVARGGGDESVIAVRHGRQVYIRYADAEGADTMRLAGHVAALIKELNPGRVGIDVVGVGAGVADRLREQFGALIVDLNAGWGATEIDEQGDTVFDGIRSQWWWDVRSLFDPAEIERSGEWLCIDPDDDELADQLCSMKWWPTSRGKIHVESKDEMAKRGLPSPDRADGLMHTVARPPAGDPGRVVLEDRVEISPY